MSSGKRNAKSKEHLPALAVFGLVAVAVYIFGLLVDSLAVRVAVKAFPVLAMIGWVWLGSARDRYARTIAVGLGFSVLGDILLEFRETLFLPGMIAFLLGHVAYVSAFAGRSRRLGLLFLLPFAGWVAWILATVWQGMGDLRIPVVVYTLVIMSMMWRAAVLLQDAVDEERVARAAWLGLLGAMLFGFSDSLIALNKFHDPMDGARIAIITTYWAGQLLIAASAVFHPSDLGQEAQGAGS